MKRRQALGHLQKLFLGTILFSSPYASALEHLDNLDLSTMPDPMQKQLIESNVEFMLASECGIVDDPDECRVKYCMNVAMKNKCHNYGEI